MYHVYIGKSQVAASLTFRVLLYDITGFLQVFVLIEGRQKQVLSLMQRLIWMSMRKMTEGSSRTCSDACSVSAHHPCIHEKGTGHWELSNMCKYKWTWIWREKSMQCVIVLFQEMFCLNEAEVSGTAEGPETKTTQVREVSLFCNLWYQICLLYRTLQWRLSNENSFTKTYKISCKKVYTYVCVFSNE